jgi:hypothetical protein
LFSGLLLLLPLLLLLLLRLRFSQKLHETGHSDVVQIEMTAAIGGEKNSQVEQQMA